MDLFLYIMAGAGVGLAIGITGVGGGSLMTPLLILFGFPYNVAIGTDLLYAAITKAGGVFTHQKLGNIRWRLVFLLGAGSVPASLGTSWFLDTIFGSPEKYEPLMTASLGLMLIITSAVLLLRRKIQQPPADDSSSTAHWIRAHSNSVIVLMGVILGVVVTLSSVGAGAFCAAILMVLYPRLPALQVVGTDIAHAVPLTLVAGLGHMILLGNVDFLLLACLLVGSLPAIHYGSMLGSKLPNNVLQPVLASLLMMLGVKFTFF